ncbi:Histone-lysine N-methyltransferase SETMAR [Eumeta japonica]|uniref:Histone-lysine N-methyltransferase SETMAR n=1 Tax=Eumeta variegata TaxID=151549 RepID=A0A4C1YDE8_EUMVA|nr:Histone-lysine N-methyltransferase SETMAR [Eumeta japonica]
MDNCIGIESETGNGPGSGSRIDIEKKTMIAIIDEPCSSRPVTDKVDAVLEKVGEDRHINSDDIVEDMKIDHKTVLTDLKRAGYTKKLDSWIPYELIERN